MNLELFNNLWSMNPPLSQDLHEWRTFLEICEVYLEKHGIKNPIAVELGLWRNGQKKFYEQILGGHHIGIDISKKKSKPDIQGSTHDPKTLATLKNRLEGKPIDILFIDASHWYDDVKKDFEIYSPLCTGIIAFHDINLGRYHKKRANWRVWKLWDELKAESNIYAGKHKDFLFISIEEAKGIAGIGLMVRK